MHQMNSLPSTDERLSMNADGSEKMVFPTKIAAECYDGCQWSTDSNSCEAYSWFPRLIELIRPEAGSLANMRML